MLTQKNNNTCLGDSLCSAGTQLGKLHRLFVTMSMATYYILRTHTGTGVSYSQHRKTRKTFTLLLLVVVSVASVVAAAAAAAAAAVAVVVVWNSCKRCLPSVDNVELSLVVVVHTAASFHHLDDQIEQVPVVSFYQCNLPAIILPTNKQLVNEPTHQIISKSITQTTNQTTIPTIETRVQEKVHNKVNETDKEVSS